MIRRPVSSEFWLIEHATHAAVAVELARHVGGAYARPRRFEEWVDAIALQNAGWPPHDQQPMLDARGRPLDVADAPPAVLLAIWSASADRACEAGDFAGLLVSLRGLQGSAHLAADATPAERDDPRARFDLNKFQHAEFERQELLRDRLGLRNDRPLRLGLAEPKSDARSDPVERELVHALRLLQAMDSVALSACRGAAPAAAVKPLYAGPDLRPAPLTIRIAGTGRVEVSPFPFVAEVAVSIPYRRLKATAFGSVGAFREAYADARIEQFAVRVAPVGVGG